MNPIDTNAGPVDDKRANQSQNTTAKGKPGLLSRQVAATLLTRIYDDGRGLDGLLDTKHGPAELRTLSAADQGLVRAIVTTALRHRGEIEFALSKVLDRKPPQKARHLIHTLHVAAAQILFMDAPDSAAVNLAVTSLQREKRSQRFSGLANAVLRKLARDGKDILAKGQDSDAAVANMAPWLRKRVRRDYGRDRMAAIAAQHMLEPIIDLAVKSDPQGWAEKLGGIALFGNAIRLNAPGRVSDWEGYDDGQWWVQDAAAQIPAHLLGDIAGKQVLDLCAAPGGKTAQLIHAGAHVTALEAAASRIERLKENLQRLNMQADTICADLFDYQPEALFDAVLLDAPCSSTGTIRRHPDVQWTKSEAIVEDLAALQKRMIIKAASFLKPGGSLVFANCSIDRAEGEDVYAAIVAGGYGLEPIPIIAQDVFNMTQAITGQGTLRTLPHHMDSVEPPTASNIDPARFTGLDGFFAARFRRTDEVLNNDPDPATVNL